MPVVFNVEPPYPLIMWRVYVRNHPKLGPLFVRVEQKPGWVWKIAMLAAVITVVVPLMLLAMAALLVGLVVFITLGILASIISSVTGLCGAGRSVPTNDPDERVNVRVMRDERL